MAAILVLTNTAYLPYLVFRPEHPRGERLPASEVMMMMMMMRRRRRRRMTMTMKRSRRRGILRI
jgi:hypothetical protein